MQSPGRAHTRTIPMVPAGPHRSDRRSMKGTLTVGPVRFSIMAVALLFVSSPWTPDPCNTPTMCSRYHSGARQGVQLHVRPGCHPPQGVGTQSHGCGPLARQVLPGQQVTGAWSVCLIPHPAAQPL